MTDFPFTPPGDDQPDDAEPVDSIGDEIAKMLGKKQSIGDAMDNMAEIVGRYYAGLSNYMDPDTAMAVILNFQMCFLQNYSPTPDEDNEP